MALNTPDGTSELTVSSAEGHLYDLLSKMEEPETREDEAADAGTQPDEPAERDPAAEDEAAQDDEPAEQDEPEAPAQKPELHRVKVDNEEIEVTLEEALKGYSRTADYTRKTQALAEQRKQYEAEVAAARQQRTQYDSVLGQMDEALKEIAPEEPNWELIQRDYPEQYTAIHARWNAIRQKREAIAAERTRVASEQAKELAEQQQTYLTRERERLFEVIPEWKDEKVAAKEAADVISFAKSMGFTDAELKAVSDHRALRVMRLAALAHKATTAKSAPKPESTGPKIKTATPGSIAPAVPKKVAEQKRALERLHKSGRVDDAAATFLTMLPPDR